MTFPKKELHECDKRKLFVALFFFFSSNTHTHTRHDRNHNHDFRLWKKARSNKSHSNGTSLVFHSTRACYGVVRFVMESEARGCEVIVSGKLRAARAKSMKFTDGYMVKSGQPKKTYVDTAVRHVKLRQGVLGVKVSIMLPHDPTGRNGPSEIQPDVVQVLEPKDEMGAVAKQ
jgi:hypothetical protein